MPLAFLPPTGMPRVSTGLPTYGSDITYPPANVTDDHYYNQWATNVLPAWLAVDVSSLSTMQRRNLLLLLDNETGNFLIPSYQGYPTNYTVQGSAAAGGGSAPADGDASWVTLLTVSGQAVPRRRLLLGDVAQYNWIKVRITAYSASSDGWLHLVALDLFDGHLGQTDSIVVVGDSTTQEGCGLADATTGLEFSGGPIPRLVQTRRAGHWPLLIGAGNGGMAMQFMHDNIAALLADFGGSFCVFQMGLNDANAQLDLSQGANAAIVSTWYSQLLYCIDYALAQGITPLLGKIQWATANTWTASNAVILNAKVEQALTVDRVQCLRGPDMYTAFNGQSSLLRSDHLHPTYGVGGGYELWQATLANAIVAALYVTPPIAAQVQSQIIPIGSAGALARVNLTFTDPIAGVKVDPTAITLKGQDPTGALTTLTLAGAGIVRDGLGLYHGFFDTTGKPGRWLYAVSCPVPVQAALVHAFVVDTDPTA